jgi:hypothetical protein
MGTIMEREPTPIPLKDVSSDEREEGKVDLRDESSSEN